MQASICLGFNLSSNRYQPRGGTLLVSDRSHPNEETDDLLLQELIAGIVRQDQVAFNALFKRLNARVYSLALRITANPQMAEEVTEDTFFQIWRQAPRFDPSRGNAKAWILTITRSRALDARRSMPQFEPLPETEDAAQTISNGFNTVPDLLAASEDNQQLHAALQNLEAVPRQLLALAYFRGLSHDEIAAQTKLPLGTVKSHLRRSLIHLREILSENLLS